MIVRALDDSGDWLFGKGRNDYLRNNAAITQNIKTRLLSFQGDCFFDTGAGLDWFTYLGGSKNQTLVNLSISSVILNTPDITTQGVTRQGVLGLLQLSINLSNTRAFSVSYRAQTVYSITTGNFTYDLNGSI